MANKKVSQLTSKPSVLTTDLFPIADPSTGQLYKTTISDLGTAIGSGVSSVNSLVGAVVLDTDDIQELVSPTNKWFTDTRARAALSASSPLAYNSGTGVFSLPQANGSTNGFLSSADWTTFNNKLSTATAASTYVPYTGATGNVNLGLDYSITAALIIKSGGTSTQFLKADGSIDTNTYLTTSSAASTYLPLTGGTLTGDLTLSSTNPRLYLTDTDNNPDYFISNTDGTFTIYDVTNSTSRLTISTLNTILNTNLRVDGDVLIKQDSVFGGVAGYTGIGSDSSGIYLKLGTANSHAYLVLSGLTSYRNFTLPDATGTFALTSDLSSYLPLSGGTLTGALSGTSATFSSTLTATKGTFNGTTSEPIRIERVVSGTTVGRYSLAISGAGNFSLYDATADSDRLIIAASTGAATFSSSVTATSYSIAANGSLFSSTFWGTTNQAGTGSYADWALLNSSTTRIMHNPTGTLNMVFNGNVGIGTTSPSYLLDVRAVGFGIQHYGNSTNILRTYAGSGYQIIEATNSGVASQFGYEAGAYFVETAATRRMHITTAGNVGIGTTTPGVKLTVFTSGQSFTSSTITYSAGSSQGFLLDNSAGTSQSGNAIWFANSGLYSAIASTRVDTGTWGTDLRFYTHPDAVTNQYDVTERMRITSGGVINIGTSSQATNKQIQFQLDNTTNYYGLLNNSSRKDYLTINGGDGASYTSGANITLIGSDRYGTNMGGQLVLSAGNSSGDTSFGHIELRTSGSERMRITSSGGVGINTTPDSGFKLHVNGYVKFNDASGVQLSSGSQYRQIYFDGFNTLYFWNGSNQSNLSSAGAWVNASDASIKKDVTPIKYGLSDLMLLNPRSYKMKTDDLEQIGFIAQEVEQVIPEVVNSDNKGMKGLSYGNMVALLTKSIQELKAELDTLKNK